MVKKEDTTKKLKLKEKLNDDMLDISLHGLETVPVKEITEINKAKKLNLSYNKLTDLPDDFIKLSYIKELDLSKNSLKSLPDNFGDMTSLKSLDLLGNQLTDLPSSFGELKNLMWLDLKDNPLNPELKQIVGECSDEMQCKKCASNVIKYLKQRAANEERERQIQIEKKKKKQEKIEARERKEAAELRLKKKLEREQRNLMKEKSKSQLDQNKVENVEPDRIKPANSFEPKKKSPGLCWTFFKLLIHWLFFVSICIAIYLITFDYCNKTAAQRQKLIGESFKQIFKQVDLKVCPHIKQLDHPFLADIRRSFNNLLKQYANHF